MTKLEEARKLSDDAKELNLLIGRSWVALASIYSRFKSEILYKELGFETMSDWLAEIGDKGPSQAYAMAGIYDKLKEKLPEPVIAQMTMSNARDLAQFDAKDITADMAQAATNLPNNKFRQVLNETKGMNLEQRVYKGFFFEASQREIVEATLKVIMEREEIKSESGALEWLCADYCAREGLDFVKPVGTKVDMSTPGQPRIN